MNAKDNYLSQKILLQRRSRRRRRRWPSSEDRQAFDIYDRLAF